MILSTGKKVGIYLLIILVQLIAAGYTVLTHDAIRKGNADALVFSLYRDALAFPILLLWAFLAEHLPSKKKFRSSRGGGCCGGSGGSSGSARDAAQSAWSNASNESLITDELERSIDAEALKSAEKFKHRTMCPRCKDVPRFFFLGLFGMFGNQFCYIMALEYISSDVAAILNLSQIVFVAFLAASPIARYLGAEQERPSWSIAGGLVLALGGAAVMLQPWEVFAPSNHSASANGTVPTNATTGGSTPKLDHDQWVGYLFVTGSCIAMSLYYLLQKKALHDYAPVTVTAYSYFFGAATMGLVSLYNVAIQNYSAFVLQTEALEALAFAVVANSVVKYGISSIANKFVSATLLVAAGTLAPIFVVVLSYLDPEEHETPKLSYLGSIGIVAGIALVTFGRNRQTRRSATSITLMFDNEDSQPFPNDGPVHSLDGERLTEVAM